MQNKQASAAYEYDSPIGRLQIEANDEFITKVAFTDNVLAPEPHAPLNKEWLDALSVHPVIGLCVNELDAYFKGTLKEFTVPLKPQGTPFRTRVWEQLRAIPYGETLSYKILAASIGQPSAIRAVGGANHHNPIVILIPCHRVIGMDGSLTGYGGGLDKKAFLLAHERLFR